MTVMALFFVELMTMRYAHWGTDHDHGHDHEAHGHGHSHGVTATGQHRRRLVLVVGITAAVFVAEVVGGLVSGSLALLADAGHMLTDSTGLVIALLGFPVYYWWKRPKAGSAPAPASPP